MSEWKPKVKEGLKWESLNLSAEEGFLLSRLDGATSVDALTHLTGLPKEKVQQALQKLSTSGAIDAPQKPTLAKPAAPAKKPTKNTVEGAPLLSADNSELGGDDAAIRAALEDMSNDELDLPNLDGDDTDEGAPVDDADADALVAAALAADERAADNAADEAAAGFEFDEPTKAEEIKDSEQAPDDAAASEAVAAADKEQDKVVDGIVDEDQTNDGEKEDPEAAAVAEGNYRKLFETTLHDLPQEEREKKAREESGAVLCALCFDPIPQVIHGILENPQVGFPHARLIARHHRTPQGIEALFGRNELVRDGMVQRYLMANPMLQDSHLKKLMGPKRVAVIYKWALSRDLPEKNRNKVRNILRSKWSTAEGDERANLIWATEGRVLVMLIGIPLDSACCQQLQARTIHSVMLIQNLARFASTPPNLLVHLLKQAAVKRQAHLRNMIFQHPNCPSSEKRKAH